MMRNTKAIKVIGVLLICGLSFLFSGCVSWLYTEPITIEEGFSDALTSALKKDYDLSIPDSAEFIKGDMESSFRDPYIQIWFTIAEEDYEGMFLENWKESTYIGGAPDGFNACGEKIHNKDSIGDNKVAHVMYEQPADGRMSLYFYGRDPNRGKIK